MKHALTMFLLFGAAAWTVPTVASEGAIYGGPIGGTDIRNALLPAKPGLYGGFAWIPGSLHEYRDGSGKVAEGSSFNVSYNLMAAGVTYVWPTRLWGGTWASVLQVGYTGDARAVTNSTRESNSGFYDPYIDFIKYRLYLGRGAEPSDAQLPYGLTVAAAYSAIVPWGEYKRGSITITGRNTYFHIPNVAATYITRPSAYYDGLEFSGRLFLNHAEKNSATDYSSGDVVNLYFAVSAISGRFQYGVTGFYAKQTEADEIDGVRVAPDGRRLRYLKMRPVFSYSFQNSVTAKLKVTFPVAIEYGGVGNTIVMSIGMPLQ